MLNNIIGFLGIKPRTVTSDIIAFEGVHAENIKDREIPFLKTDGRFAPDLLDTTKRMAYPILGGAAQTVPAGNRFNVTALLGSTSACIAPPTFNESTRTWTNLGAVCYTPENRVSIRVPGNTPTASEPFHDDQGREVYGRLVYEASGAWYIDFKRLIDGLEGPYTIPAEKSLLLVIRQWVPGSSALLEDPGQVIVSAPGAVDITETNNINQIAGEIGIVLSNSGQATRPLGKSLIQKWIDHLLGMPTERHKTSQVDVSPVVAEIIPGLTEASNLDAALVSIQGSLDEVSNASRDGFRQIIKEFRSNGILSISSPLRAFDANSVSVDGFIAYVDGQRFAVEGMTGVNVQNNSFRVFYVNDSGTLVAGFFYPDTPHAKIGMASANEAGTVSIREDHTPLRVLDSRVDSVEELLTTHVATVTAHPAGSITLEPPSGITASNLQDALGQMMQIMREAMEKMPKEVRGVMMDGVTEPLPINSELDVLAGVNFGLIIEASIRQGADAVFCGHIYVVSNDDGSRLDCMVHGLDMGDIGLSITAVKENNLIKLKYTSAEMAGPALYLFKVSRL